MTGPELEDFFSLRKDIPENARESILRWIFNNKADHERIDWSIMLEFQQAARVDLGFLTVSSVRVSQAHQVLRKLDPTHRLWLTDFRLSRFALNRQKEPDLVTALKKILRDSGSSWTVGLVGNRYRLVEVLPGAVVNVVEHMVSRNDKASELLRSAWESAFGVNPKPSHAYYDAVRSVETLSCPLVSPNDSNATLGKNINVLRNSPNKWSFVMNGSVQTSSIEHLVGMMRLLWHSQTDRHGKADYEDVSLEEAQAAILLASTLLGWLAKGFLKRVES